MTLKVPKGSHLENPAKKTGTSGLRQIQREPNPLARPWKSHRVTSVTRCFWWGQVLVPDAAGRGSRLIQFGETFAALLFFTWLPGDMQPAARLTAARLDPRLESILVGIPCVLNLQQAGRFLPCPTPDHWQLRNQATPQHSFPWSPIYGASLKGRSGWSRSASQSHEAEHWGVLVIWCCF